MSETQIVWLQLNPKQKFYENITLESGANLPFSHYNFQIETYRIFNKKKNNTRSNLLTLSGVECMWLKALETS